jgi:gamma-glutamyltranspeptidase/glutathione hydrolase
MVVAARSAAAEAGAQALAAGGSAVDAAVATGFALCVVDQANCGIGGYGGFLTYLPPQGRAVCVDFNTWVPDRFDVAGFRLPGDDSQLVDGGRSVAPPMVVPGLLAAHERFGRLPLGDVLRPALRLAREGFPVGRDLARALREHWERTGGGTPEFARIFHSHGAPLEEGGTLVQPELASVLEEIGERGADALRSGPLVEAICGATAADGGLLAPEDFLLDSVSIAPAGRVTFGPATVCGAPRETSGAGVLFDALAAVDPDRLRANRDRGYIAELARALRGAWDARTAEARVALDARHTTTMAAADADGGLVALTFTQGSLYFGSGVVPPGTGIVLNAGANLFATAPDGPLAMTNMSPVVVDRGDGVRYALGATGGPRIPGLLLTAVVDVVHYRSTLADAIAAPHLSVRALDGTLEAEPELLDVAGGGSPIGIGEFGPASGITRTVEGCEAAVDPRFGSGVATV